MTPLILKDFFIVIILFQGESKKNSKKFIISGGGDQKKKRVLFQSSSQYIIGITVIRYAIQVDLFYVPACYSHSLEEMYIIIFPREIKDIY